MSSWRESDSEPSKPARPAKPTKPISPPPKTPGPSAGKASAGRASAGRASAGKTDWRGRPSGNANPTSQRAGSASGKDWLNPEATDPGFSRSTVKKWSVIGVLFSAFVVTTTLFVRWVFFDQPKMPVYAISVGQYDSTDEFRENPFGNQQRKQIEAVNKSYVYPFSSEFDGNDKILGLLNSKEWLEKLQRPEELTLLGDPVTAYYVNCFARVQPESIKLYHQSSRPFSAESENDSSIDLQKLLENLAASAPKENFLWVILDLQLPHTISALGDLSPLWKSAVSNTLERIKRENPDSSQWYDRFIVTIPADDGQSNWLAPEYSASFFGYHLFKLLDTPQENSSFVRRVKRILRIPINLQEFQETLNRNVSEDVASKRFARQTPVWLPIENVQRWDSLGLVGGSIGNYQVTAVDDPKGRMQRIRLLWTKLNGESLRSAYRWDPVGYSKVESQLLALEDFALYQPDAFAQAADAVENSISRLMSPTLQFGVSLIEDDLRADYFCPDSFAEQNHSRAKLNSLFGQFKQPTFWMNQEELSQQPAASALALTNNEKLRYVWTTFLNAAKSDASVWQETFTKDRLDKALSFLDLNYESDQPPPVEIYLLQRLRNDLDWRSADIGRDRAEACAKAILTYERLQKLSSHPEPLLTRTLRDLLQNAESEFLIGLDWLLSNDRYANSLSKSIERFASAISQLQSAGAQIENLAVAIETSQEALWIAPHLLSWMLREYQFSDDVIEIEGRMKQLGVIVDESLKLLQNISTATSSGSQSSADGKQLQNQLLTLKSEFNDYLETQTDYRTTSTSGSSSQTFRRNRIAVRIPLLNNEQREGLQRNIASYLAVVGSGTAAEFAVTEQRDLRPAINAFLGPLNSEASDPTYMQLYQGICSGDLRFELLEVMAAYNKPLEADATSMHKNLMAAEVPTRILSTVIGDTPSLSRETDSQLSWPFSAASLRWKLSETERRVWQVARLAEAGWGNGTIPSKPDIKRFYFGLLGSRYLSLLPSVADPAVETRLEQLSRNGTQKLESRAQGLVDLTVQFGSEGQIIGDQDVLLAPISIQTAQTESNTAGRDWNAIATVFMGKPGQPMAWQKVPADDCALAIPLGPQDSSAAVRTTPIERSKTFSANHWSDGLLPTGNLVVRGNYRSGPIQWRSGDAPYIGLELNKEIRSDAEIYVEAAGDAPILNVAILLDCSNSMKLQVQATTESEGRNKASNTKPLFDVVTSNVKRFLGELAQAHDRREADIRVCLIPFGIGHFKSLSSGFLKSFLSEQRDTAQPSSKELVGHFYASKEFLRLDEEGRFQLEQAIDELTGETKWDTPLYDSIVEALARVKRVQGSTGQASSHVVAFTDGVHYVEVDSPYKDQTTKEMILRGVEANQSRLNIFYYNYFKRWISQKRSSERQHWERIESAGVAELEELNRQSDRIDFVQSADAALLARKSLETIPRTTVEVETLDSTTKPQVSVEPTRTGFLARVDANLLPGTFQVTSKGTRGGATQRVRLTGGERVVFSLSGRGGREFGLPTFDPDASFSGSGWVSPTQRQRAGGGFQSNCWFSPDWLKPLSFIWMMRDQEHPRKFTTRPQFAVGMLSSSTDIKLSPFLLVDSYFEPRQHYPRLRFSQVPWNENTSVKQAQLTLWVADELPSELERRTIAQEAVEADVARGKAVFSWKRSGNALNIDVHYTTPPKLDDRIVLLCPTAETCLRKYFIETDDESYHFQWDDQAVSQEIEIQITSVGEVKNWVQKGLVTEFSVDQVPTSVNP